MICNNIIQEILNQDNFKPQIPDPKHLLIGFSLGGRVALALYEMIPDAN